jgi:CubicO group peptidase (beta-lactamase class C family)
MIGRRSFLAGSALAAGGALACGAPTPTPKRSMRQGAAPRLPETEDIVDQLAAAWRKKTPVAGLSVAVICDGELAFARGHGKADLEADLNADPDTVYAIGSLTKPYTALTALRAAADGHLDLEAPLRKYLPELRSGGAAVDAITPRLLLCHRSGLLSDWHRGSMGAGPPWTELVREIADEPLIAPPDQWHAYSNVGYTLLAHALERATGRPFAELLAASVAAELGAAAPSFTAPPDLPAYYQNRRVIEPPLRLAPAAGLHGSVLTMLPLLRWLLAGGPLAAAMFDPQPAGPLDLDERWGLGLSLRHNGLDYAGRVGTHLGRTFCHRSVMCVLPDHGLAVVAMANSREGSGVEQLAITAMQTALLERHGIDLPPSRGDGDTTPPVSLGLAALRAHAGRYATDSDVTELEVEDGALVSRSETGTVWLRPAAGGEFSSSINPDARVRLRPVAGHHVLGTRIRDVEGRAAVRCPEEHVPEDWWRRLGKYRVAAPADEVLAFHEVELERQGDQLCLRVLSPLKEVPTLSRHALKLVDESHAQIFGIGRGKGQQITAEDDAADGPLLHWAGYRLLRER